MYGIFRVFAHIIFCALLCLVFKCVNNLTFFLAFFLLLCCEKTRFSMLSLARWCLFSVILINTRTKFLWLYRFLFFVFVVESHFGLVQKI